MTPNHPLTLGIGTFGAVGETDLDFGAPALDTAAEATYTSAGFAHEAVAEPDDRIVPDRLFAHPDPATPKPVSPVAASAPVAPTPPPFAPASITPTAIQPPPPSPPVPGPVTAPPPARAAGVHAATRLVVLGVLCLIAALVATLVGFGILPSPTL